MNPNPRRHFLRVSTTLAAGIFAHSLLAQDTTPPPAGVAAAPRKPPALLPEKVRDTVGAAHGNLDKLRALIEETPLLVNACWDQGGGDFETPMEAAAHMGRREIAEFLIARGARTSIYTSAMLGHLDFIKAALGSDILTAAAIPGPHGFTLLHCAKQGAAKAKPVYDWLIAQGVPEVFQRPLAFKWPEGSSK